jgi:hypothetical protein
MSGMGGMSMPSLPATPQAPTYEQAEDTAREETIELLRRKRASTVLTSPQGLLEPSQVSGKTLLGR